MHKILDNICIKNCIDIWHVIFRIIKIRFLFLFLCKEMFKYKQQIIGKYQYGNCSLKVLDCFPKKINITLCQWLFRFYLSNWTLMNKNDLPFNILFSKAYFSRMQKIVRKICMHFFYGSIF